MSLVGPLEPGLLNAWLLILAFLVAMFAPDLIVAMRKDRSPKEDPLFPPFTGSERRHDMGWKATFLFATVYSTLLPLRFGTFWIPVGIAVCLVGFILWFSTVHSIATSPPGRPFTKGPYAFSRHPMYIAQALVLLGIATSTRSWVFFAISSILIALSVALALDEEASSSLFFGEEYEKYARRTPRWLGRRRG
jgi:hypothetical protein